MKKLKHILLIALGILVLFFSSLWFYDLIKEWQFKRKRDVLIEKIQKFVDANGRSPYSLTEIGVEEVMGGRGALFYEKKGDLNYIVWYGTSLGESETYYSDNKRWEDVDRGIVNNSNYQEENEIIFWRYYASLGDRVIEILDGIDFDFLPSYIQASVKIPLSDFTGYFLDEQVLRMTRDNFNNKSYLEGLRTLLLESDGNSIFFSIIINNRIIMNGLNRTLSVTEEKRTLDGLISPQIKLSIKDDFVDFIFVNEYKVSSFLTHENNNITNVFSEVARSVN